MRRRICQNLPPPPPCLPPVRFVLCVASSTNCSIPSGLQAEPRWLLTIDSQASILQIKAEHYFSSGRTILISFVKSARINGVFFLCWGQAVQPVEPSLIGLTSLGTVEDPSGYPAPASRCPNCSFDLENPTHVAKRASPLRLNWQAA